MALSNERTPQLAYLVGVLPAGQAAGAAPWLAGPAADNAAEALRLELELRAMGEQKAAAEGEAEELRLALEDTQKLVTNLVQQVEAFHGREMELWGRLVEAHQQSSRRDDELGQLLRHITDHRDALEAQCKELHRWLNHDRHSLPRRIFRGVRKVLTLGKK